MKELNQKAVMRTGDSWDLYIIDYVHKYSRRYSLTITGTLVGGICIHCQKKNVRISMGN